MMQEQIAAIVKEMVETGNCNSSETLKQFAYERGIELSEEEAEWYWDEFCNIELSQKSLETITAGGTIGIWWQQLYQKIKTMFGRKDV